MFGFLNINKPAGPTSHDVVVQVRRLVGHRVKVGHAGTLDPFATGVLVVCLGPATRLADYIQAGAKRYRATVVLGATSSTDDRDGEIVEIPAAMPPDAGAVAAAATRFIGCIEQVPPAHSAVHVGGRRAYELARQGQRVELPVRHVHVEAVDVVRYDWPTVALDVRCGSGTYIRSLARDLGAALGVGGYCDALTRTAVGAFGIDAARPVTEIRVPDDLVPPLTAVAGWPRVVVNCEDLRRIGMGQRVHLPEPTEAGEMAIVNEAGQLVALGEVAADGRTLRPTKVFATGP